MHYRPNVFAHSVTLNFELGEGPNRGDALQTGGARIAARIRYARIYGMLILGRIGNCMHNAHYQWMIVKIFGKDCIVLAESLLIFWWLFGGGGGSWAVPMKVSR